jgi:CBS domain-containing protein
MARTRTTAKEPRASLDRSLERLRKQLANLAPYLSKGKPTCSLEEFDLETEHLIADLLGETSDLLEAYQYAERGEAAGLTNMPDEAPAGTGIDGERQRLLQRNRVLESCVSELEARRSADPKKRKTGRQVLTGPQVAEHMSLELRSLHQDATLGEAGQLMQKWKVGSLLVTDSQFYVGFITVANGMNPTTTPVNACMRAPLVSIEGDRPIIDAVRMMKEHHPAFSRDARCAIIGVISVANILRYYSGVV